MPIRPDAPLRKVTLQGDCHIFDGSKTEDGYGQFKYKGQYWLAHRYSYVLHKGPIPLGTIIRHTCDNPACINPEHLLAGTQQDNINDCIARGRRYSHPRKLDEYQKKDIIVRLLEGHTYQAIADDYNVSKQTIYRIANGFR